MVICLESSILGGYLTNEIPGLITGVLHLAGQRRPLNIELIGNFLRDIAGCRIDLLNPLPDSDVDVIQHLSLQQAGQAGVMTASHRAMKLPRRKNTGAAGYAMPEPAGLKNLIFLEWFNRDSQRVLIQSWHLQLRVSAPQWSLSKDAEAAQMRQNRARRRHFLLNRSRRPAENELAPQPPMVNDPFAPESTIRDPFAAAATLPPPKEPAKPSANPAQRSAALAEELHRFEQLIHGSEEAATKPAVMQLLITVSDLAAHLTHALRQFADGGRTQWHFLVVDLEQSLPVFGAAMDACDRVMRQSGGADSQWLSGLQRCLLSIDLRMRELLKLLREY